MFALPLFATVGWSIVSSWWGSFLLPLLKAIPWQVWAGVGLVIAFLWYGHIRENRGWDKCHVQVVAATQKETQHRLEAASEATAEAQSRAQESARRAQTAEDDNVKLQGEVSQLKTAKVVCLPKSVTDRLGSSRGVRKYP